MNVASRIFRGITTMFGNFMSVRSKSKANESNYRIVHAYRCCYQPMVSFHRPKNCSTSSTFVPIFVMRCSKASINGSIRIDCGLINLLNRNLIRILTYLIMLISLSNFLRNGERVFFDGRIGDFFPILSASKNISTKACFRCGIASNSILIHRSTSVGSYFRTCTKVAIRLLRAIMNRGTIFARGKSGVQYSASNTRIRWESGIVRLSAIIRNGYLRRLGTCATSKRVFVEVNIIFPFNVRGNCDEKRCVVKSVVITSSRVGTFLLNMYSFFSNFSATIRCGGRACAALYNVICSLS